MFAVLLGLGLAVRGFGADTAGPILQIEAGGHTAICRWMGFTPDGRQLVSAGDDKVVRVWDLSQVIQAFSQSGMAVAKGAPAKVPLARSVRLQIGPGAEGKINSCAISSRPLPGGGWLLAAGGYGTKEHWGDIHLVDLSSGQVLGLLQGHSSVIHSLTFSLDGRMLVSGGQDRTVRVWDLSSAPGDWKAAADGTLRVKCDVLEGHEAGIYGLTFVGGPEDSITLASGSYDKTLRLWRRDAKGAWRTAAVGRGHTAEVSCVAASPDGRYLASASHDRTVRLWDGRDGKFIRVLGETGEKAGSTAMIAFTPDGQALLVAGDRDFGCQVWRVSDGKELASFKEHNNTIISVAKTRVAADPSGKQPAARSGGTLVATAGGDNNDIFLWDATIGRTLGHIAGSGRPVFAAAFSPDARWISWGTGNDGGTITATSPIEHVFDLSEMHPDKKAVAGASWQRAFLKQAGWSAERPEDAQHKLIVRREGHETARIERDSPYDRIHCYSFVPGGGMVVGSNFKLTLHDPATGEVRRTFTGHTGVTWAMAVSADGRLLLSGSKDQTFRLWNLATGELLLSVFASYEADGRVGEWVAWTPAGYYKASPGGDQLIGWHANRGVDKAADFVAAWQMRKLFEKPEIVELTPATLSVKGAVEQYAKSPGQRHVEPLNIQQDLARLLPPSIVISEPANFQKVKKEKVPLRAKVWPTGTQPISEVRVLINGRPPPDFAGLKPAPGTSATEPREIQFDAPLEPGMNKIQVLAVTAAGATGTASVDVLRETLTGGAQPAKPSCYFLGIGIAKYEDKSLNLKFPADDARDLAAAFRRQEGKLFAKVESKVITEKPVPRDIKRGLNWLRQSVTKGDLAVVFVSAHGWPQGREEYYLAPYDFRTEEPSVTGFSKEELETELRKLPCKVLVVLDACYSGKVVKEFAMAKGAEDALQQVVKDFSRIESGLVVIGSSTGRERSWEKPEWGHGALAVAMIEALTGESQIGTVVDRVSADSNGDGVLYADELATYLANRVKDLTGGQQHVMPGFGIPPFPMAIVGKIMPSEGGLDGARPKGVRTDVLRFPLAGLPAAIRGSALARLSAASRFDQLLRRHYSGATRIAQTPGELEFEVEGLRGVVSGDATRWERLTINFSVDQEGEEPKEQQPENRQLKFKCWGWGLHVKSDSPQQPADRAFKNSLYPEYESQLKRELKSLLGEIEKGAKELAP